MGKGYDLKFDFDSDKQYCSKLIYDVYQSAFDVEVGTIETLGDLRDRIKDQPTYEEDLAFWTVYFGGKIPRSQRIITPESQYEDPRLITVFDNSTKAIF